MTIKVNPPQFEIDDSDHVRLYKQRQFVEDVIRALDEVSDILGGGAGGGGTGGSGDGYPPQLGYIGIVG